MNETSPALGEAAKAAPPAGVIGAKLAGIDLNDVVLYGSALLIALQIFFLLRKEVYLPWKEARGRSE